MSAVEINHKVLSEVNGCYLFSSKTATDSRNRITSLNRAMFQIKKKRYLLAMHFRQRWTRSCMQRAETIQFYAHVIVATAKKRLTHHRTLFTSTVCFSVNVQGASINVCSWNLFHMELFNDTHLLCALFYQTAISNNVKMNYVIGC